MSVIISNINNLYKKERYKVRDKDTYRPLLDYNHESAVFRMRILFTITTNWLL